MVSIQETSADEMVLSIGSTLTGQDNHMLERLFRRAAQSPYQNITLDLSGVDSLSPFVMVKILLLNEYLRPGKKRLQIKGCSSSVVSALRLIKADRMIHNL